MRKLLIAVCSLGIVGAGVYLAAQPQDQRIKLRFKLLDDNTNKPISGILRVSSADKNYVELPGLFDRITGMTKDLPDVHWYCIPADGAETSLLAGKYRLHAVSGLETATSMSEINIDAKSPAEIAIKMRFLFRPEQESLAAGNTHLHLRGFSLDTADEYLRKIPSADRLRVMFVSYLERDKDDLTYITNKYPIGPMPKFDATGVLFNNGQEHRHNFEAYGQGYGHVMFLNIKDLVQPVSIGPGITNKGFDDLALRSGIDNARKQGGTVIWCHNTNGFEDVLNVLTNRLDALNVFDGSRGGTFEENYYRYLNLGIKMPISTGTDWFMYDMSRVYAEVRGKLTIASWLDAVKAGRCQATNGPLLRLEIDEKKMGDVINLKDAKTLKVNASSIGRFPMGKLELLQNGKVIKTQMAKAAETHLSLTHEVRVAEPAWFAVRIDSRAKNEFDKTIFAHSSPIYVNFRGQGVFNVEDAFALLKQVEEGQATIKAKGRFSSDEASRKLLALYDGAANDLRTRIEKRK